MGIVASVLIGLAGLVHVYIFVLESVRWRAPATWRIFGLRSQEEADTTAPLAYNQGFYNLFLAVGAVLGVVLFVAGEPGSTVHTAGFTLALFTAASMVLAAAVLLSTGRSRLRSAAVQGALPLLGLALLLLSLLTLS
jgi:putative membrane protein